MTVFVIELKVLVNLFAVVIKIVKLKILIDGIQMITV